MSALLSRARDTEATIWVGKEGVSKALLLQVENQLKNRELVKLKIQRSALSVVSASELAKRVAASTDSTLVDVMGHTFALYRKREKVIEKKNIRPKISAAVY